MNDMSDSRSSNNLIYAGIGSRATPPEVLADMTKMAAWLARTGWRLSTGGATGADTAFADGAPADRRTLHLPWRGYNGHEGADCHVVSGEQRETCLKIASRLHPAWSRCSSGARSLHARNVSVMLGASLERPVDAVVAWTPNGHIQGGTGLGLRIAMDYDIPVLNLAVMTPRAACERLLEIRRAA